VPTEHRNLEEYRIRASRLMKDLRDADPTTALHAARRFQVLSAWAGTTTEQIRDARDRVQRKHALAVVAREGGFRDWLHLRASVEDAPDETGFDTTRLFPPRNAVFLNLWFAHYEEARKVLDADPTRYLFPYRHQYVLCEAGLLENLGLDAADPDWDRMGRDWVNPRDTEARARLAVRLLRAVP
jgi:hypothetical protein